MSTILRSIGINIRFNRKKVGWSQEKLAIRSKVSSDYMGRLERGEVNVSVETLSRISKALRIPFIDLMKGLE